MPSRGALSVLVLCVIVLVLFTSPACVTKTAATSGVPALTFMVAPPGSVLTGSQTPLVAQLSSDPQSMGINWTASCQSTDCGSFNPVNTLSGIQTVYTAPKTVPQGCLTATGSVPCVNITAQAAALPSDTATISVSVVTGVTITLTTVPVGQLSAGGTTQVGATISGSASSVAAGVNWQILNCTAAICGNIPLTSNSGIPITYTAPATVTSAFTFQIQGTAAADTTQTVTTAPIRVIPGTVPTVQFTSVTSTSIQPSGTVTLVASVSNDANPPQGVDWGLVCTNSVAANQCGSFNPSGTPPNTASGAQMVYTAPAQAQVPPAGLSVSIQAYPAANPSAIITEQVTISLPTIAISFSQAPPSSLQVSQTATIAANVTNDPTTGGGVDWTLSCTPTGACGHFDNGQTTEHTTDAESSGSVKYTAPSSVPTSAVTITACATATQDATCVTPAPQVTIVPATGTAINWTSGEAPPSQLVESGQSKISATVSPSTDTSGVNWTLACTPGPSGSCGTFDQQDCTNPTANPPCTQAHTASAVALTYTAPTDIPSGGVNFTAVVADDTSVQITGAIQIIAPTPVVTFTSQIPSSLEVGTSITLTAKITNDNPPPNDGATWSCTPSDSCGTFGTPTNTSGSSSVTYTAPATVPTTNSGKVVITATSVADTSISVSTNPGIQITPNPNLALLNGQYVFEVSGTSTDGFYGLAGAIVADGKGDITNGEEDLVEQCGPVQVTNLQGTYSIGPDGRGTMTFQPGGSGSCIPATQTFKFVIVGGAAGSPRALITEFDNDSASGRVDEQASPVPTPSGSYAFTSTGNDINNPNPGSNIGTTDMGGVISVSGTTYTIEQDTNDQGTATQTKATNAWTFSGSLDSFGRGILSRNSNSFEIFFYVANSGLIDLLEGDGNYIEAGTAFTSSSTVHNGPYVFTLSGVDNSQASTGVFNLVAAGGLFTTNGTGLSNATIDVNDGGTLTKDSAFSGTVAAPTSGRGTLSLTSTPGLANFAYYPTANNGLLLLETDGTTGFVSIGTALPQTATPIFAAGNYGMNLTNSTGGAPYAQEDVVGQVVSNGTSAFAGTVDVNDSEGSLGNSYPDTPLLGSFGSATNGRFTGSFSLTLTSTDTQTIQEVFYVVDSTPAPLAPQDVAMGQLTSSSPDGSCSQAGACLSLTLPAGTKSIGAALGNSLNATAFSATVVFEVSTDGGSSWSAASCSPGASETSASLTECTPASNTTTFRARVSSYTSGTVLVTIIADTTESTFAPGSSASDPNSLSPVPTCSTSDTTLSQLLYFDTTSAQLFYCTTPQGAATSSWGQFTGVGPNTVLFLELDANQETTGIMRLQSLP